MERIAPKSKGKFIYLVVKNSFIRIPNKKYDQSWSIRFIYDWSCLNVVYYSCLFDVTRETQV